MRLFLSSKDDRVLTRSSLLVVWKLLPVKSRFVKKKRHVFATLNSGGCTTSRKTVVSMLRRHHDLDEPELVLVRGRTSGAGMAAACVHVLFRLRQGKGYEAAAAAISKEVHGGTELGGGGNRRSSLFSVCRGAHLTR